jgi:hypothetical protein
MLRQRKTANPPGTSKKLALQVSFDCRLKLKFDGAKFTADTVANFACFGTALTTRDRLLLQKPFFFPA